MIKAVILDVDGVIAGPRSDRFPHPSTRIGEALCSVIGGGVPVSLLSGKTGFAIGDSVRDMRLPGLHVADSGAVVFNPTSGEVAYQAVLSPQQIETVFSLFHDAGIVLHTFTSSAYYANAPLPDHVEEYYRAIMNRSAQVWTSDLAQSVHVVKINLYANNDEEKAMVDERIVRLVGTGLHVNPWSKNPSLSSRVNIRNITAAGVSKYSGAKHLLKHLGVDFEHVLGVGDTIHDWDFIEHCGYKGIMSNATDELKARFNLEDPHQHMGGHVDEDGLIEILNHFKLTNHD